MKPIIFINNSVSGSSILDWSTNEIGFSKYVNKNLQYILKENTDIMELKQNVDKYLLIMVLLIQSMPLLKDLFGHLGNNILQLMGLGITHQLLDLIHEVVRLLLLLKEQ